VILLGDGAVGKSALANRFIDKTTFVKDHVPTVVDKYQKTLQIVDPDNYERSISLNVKDIGHSYVSDKFVVDNDAFLVCYDVTNADSFHNISRHF
jgi:GTPase SAR1 family protein